MARLPFIQSTDNNDSVKSPQGVTLYRYCWGNNPKRRTLKDRVCRLIARGAMNSVQVEFSDNGQREIVSLRALRRIVEAAR